MKQGRDVSIPITIVVLLLVLRLAGRGRHPAAARADRACSPRSASSPSPSHVVPADAEHQRGDPADRARGRRRLLALLHQARARGTGRRAERARRARGRRRHVGPRGPDLRLHGLIAMAGHVLRRRQDVPLVRVATIIVVAVAMLGSLTVLPALLSRLGDRVEKGRIPFLHRLRARRRREPVLEGDPRRGAAAPGSSRRSLAGGLLLALAIPAFQLHTAQSGSRRCRKNAPTVDTILQRSRTRSRTARRPRDRRDRGGHRSRRRRSRRSPTLQAQALASGQMNEPIESRSTPSHDVAGSTIPLAGNGIDDEPERGADDAARGDRLPADLGKVPGATYAVTGGTATVGRPERAPEEQGADRVRLRPDLRVPAAAGLVPLDRDRAEGDRAQPALGRARPSAC